MNGMKAKAARRARERRYTADGLPRDAREWTEEDWMDLWRATEWVKARVRRRHRDDDHRPPLSR